MTAFVIFLVICLGVAYVADIYWPFLVSGISSIITGMVVFVDQLFSYLDLQQAKWEPHSFLEGMSYVFKPETYIGSWVAAPQSLKGLHGFLESMPLTLSLIIMGVILISFYMKKNQM